jgi:hypothetical protein
MMGKQSAPEELFYRFRLDDYVRSGHALRLLDAVLDFTWVCVERHRGPRFR